MHQQQAAFENIGGKGEIARNEQFLLFPLCFLLNHITVSTFFHIFDIISLFDAELEEPKICISGKGLIISNISGSGSCSDRCCGRTYIAQPETGEKASAVDFDLAK